ncbi:histone H1.11L-like [Eublepharis macularius]|uniref:Histone H1.11L-like n=1 Tax=Eublepharis macularius TaxID=481883 RepID=A0AA97KUY3_EUBMA|nr:histone H1.11L-like [Eublepharis macularius]
MMVRGKLQGGALAKAGTSTAISPSSAAPKKEGRSRASYKAAKLPYSLSQLIFQAFDTCSARKGLSLAALKKYLTDVGYNVHKNNSRLKRELNNLVSHGLLVRLGGASGSFQLSHQAKRTGKSEPAKKKKAAKKPSVSRKSPKTEKKQPPAKPPNRQSNRAANRSRNHQFNNPPAGSSRKVPVKNTRRDKVK